MNKQNVSKIIYLYRHGETDFNVNDITMGQLEGIQTKFTEKGYQEIYDISEDLKRNNVEVIYSSDFNRTMETAQIANHQLNLPIFISKEVRGLNMGKYQGLSFEKFINSDKVKESFRNYDVPFEGGESINDLNERMTNFIKKVVNETEYRNIAIITHSAAISNLKAYISNEDYISVKMCCLVYNNGDLMALDYIPVKRDVKEKINK